MIVASAHHSNHLALEPLHATFDNRKAITLANSVLQLSENASDASINARKCSVRGCTKMIPSGSDNKMCEMCRSRHRVYATTKRAKRKMEKAALSQVIGPAGTENHQTGAENRQTGTENQSAIPVPLESSINHTAETTPTANSTVVSHFARMMGTFVG
jgi:hypothetical protein